ncbi:MAG: hypothetical protein PV344_07165, partial [Anaplasma sp.]|nr:hypothetical protein [Anaplasma sp.]
MLTYCPNFSRDLYFANQKRFAKFAKIRSSRKFSRLQYLYIEFWKLYIARQKCAILATLTFLS